MLGTFLIGEIQTQQFFFTVDRQPQQGVDGFAEIAAVFLDLVVDRIQPDDGIVASRSRSRQAASSGSSLSVIALSVPFESDIPYSTLICPRIS